MCTRTNSTAIYYHQSNKPDIPFRSNIVIKNNYIERGGITLQMSNENVDAPTIIQIVGNSIPADSGVNEYGFIASGAAFTYNRILAWNNEIR